MALVSVKSDERAFLWKMMSASWNTSLASSLEPLLSRTSLRTFGKCV